MYHIQKLTLSRGLTDPEFSREILSKMDANAFDAKPEYRELFQVMRRYYRTHNKPLNEESFLTLIEDKLVKQGKSDEELNKYYDEASDLYDVTYDEDEEVINEQITKFVRKTLTVSALQEFINSGELDSEGRLEDIATELKEIAVMNTTTEREGGGIDFFNDIEEKKEMYKNLRTTAYPTGFKTIDNLLDGGGLGKGELALLIAPTGTGKAQPNYSEVKTPRGSRRIGSLKVGDEVFGTQGIHTVTGVYPQGELDVYEVALDDGTIIEVNGEHLWSYETSYGVETKTTKEMMEAEEINYLLPQITPVEYPSKEVEVDPYLVGTQAHSIPKEYLFNDVATRKQLFLGIMSNFERRGNNFLVTDVEYPFARQISELANGLGYHVLNYITGDDTTLVISDRGKRIVDICKSDRKTEMTCISVSAGNKLYLTTNYTPTHNTTFTIQLTNNAVKQGLNSLYISLEEKLDRLTFRFDNNFLGTGGDFFFDENGDLNEELFMGTQEIYKEQKDSLGELYIEKRNPREVTVDGLEQIIVDTMIRKGKELDFLVIDYPAILQMPGNDEDHKYIGKVFEQIRAIAQKYNVVCWTLAQTNRTAHQADIITAANIEGGRKVLNSAEFVVTLNRKPEEYKNGFIRLHLDKVRNPAPGIALPEEVGFRVNNRGYQIRDLSEEEVSEHNMLLRDIYKDSASGYELAQDNINQLNQNLSGGF